MTPEEHLAHLREESAWTLPQITPRRASPTRRPRSLLAQVGVPVVSGLAVAAIVVFAVGAIRGGPSPAVPEPTLSASSSPTPTPTPSPTDTAIPEEQTTAWTSPPVLAFGGDCGRVFSDAQFASYLGVPKAQHAEGWSSDVKSWLSYAVIRHNGGLLCTWNDGAGEIDPGSHPAVRVVVLAASAFPGAHSYLDCPDQTNGCNFVEGAGGYLIAGSVSVGGSGSPTMKQNDVAESVVEGIVRDFPASAAAAGPPPASWTRQAGNWPTQIDCARLFDKAGAWKALGIKPMKFSPPDSDGWPSRVEDELTVGHGYTLCGAGDTGSTVGAQVLSGGSWLEKEVSKIAGAKDVTVAGADRAIEWAVDPGEGEITSLYVFSGSNVLSFGSYDGGAVDRRVAADLLAQLNRGSSH